MNTDDFSATPAHLRGGGRSSLRLTCAGVLALMTACGGGGGSDAPTVAQPTATTLTGTAATGAALAGANVLVTDQTGATACDTTTDAQGVFTCPLPAGTPRPLVLRASKDETVLYSATATTGDVRANVTPLTTIIASRLAPDGNPATLSTTVRTTPQAVTADTLRAQSDVLIAALQPLLTALKIATPIDPLAGELEANGTGQDMVLDAIAVTVRPDGTASNIEITVKTVPVSTSSAPVSIQFRSDVAAVPALPATLAAADLSAIPGPALLANLGQRLTACYALTLSQRVNAANDTTSVTGTASDVIAPACRSLFVDNDPARYLNSGTRVARNASNAGAFAGLFRAGATGVVFSDTKFEYFRANGDMIVSDQVVDTQGATTYNSYVVRKENDVLKLIGNQYAYPSAIRPFTEDREFLNTPQFSYYQTGYNVRVDNRTDGNGNSIFSKVLVTTPWATQLTLLPAPGQLLLSISPDGVTPTGTSILRLGAGYYDATSTAAPPWTKDGGSAIGTAISDAEIAMLNDQGQWTFEFFFADGRPNEIQRNRTINRPNTIAEMRQLRFASFSAALRSQLITQSSATGAIQFAAPGVIPVGDASNPGWMVPDNSMSPTSVGAFGRAPFGSTTAGQTGNRFDDFATVAASARHATIQCSAQTAGDKHCDTTAPTLYATGSYYYMLELWGLNRRQVEISKKAGLYKLQ